MPSYDHLNPILSPGVNKPQTITIINADSASIVGMTIPVVNTSFRLPNITIPDNFALLIKAWPTNVLGALIYVGYTSWFDLDTIYPLIRNEPIAYKVKNANILYVSTNVAGSRLVITTEQISRG
jgi:hypothetical protein